MSVRVDVDQRDDHLLVSWDDGRTRGSGRFDHLPGTTPEWLGAADELFEGADRRSEARILDAVVRWAEGQDVRVGIWHDDSGVELLS